MRHLGAVHQRRLLGYAGGGAARSDVRPCGTHNGCLPNATGDPAHT